MTTQQQLSCEEVQARAGAFALDALPLDERIGVEEHIQECATCRARVAGMVETAGALPLTVDETPPPPGLRQRILDAIAQETAEAGIVSLPTPHRGDVVESEGIREATGTRRRLWSSRAWPALAAAALLMAIGLGGWNYQLQQNQPRVYTLQAQAAPGTTGQLVYLPAKHVAYLSLDNVADPGARFVYQMWLIRSGAPHSVGTVRPDSLGRAVATVSQDLVGYQQFAVTIEPEGGSTTPMGQRFLIENL